MKKNKNIKVLYIAGNGHSGSTLLDIIIGSSPEIFSAGELGYITRDTILEEKCSCGEKIKQCNLWTRIISNWESKSHISLEEYRKLRWRYERNKATLRVWRNSILPSKQFKTYCETTLALFEAIQEETGENIIVDSTKLAQRIPVLSKIVDVKVIHICRDAKGVLNSSKRSAKKDINAGIETDLPEGRTKKTLFDWTFVNFTTSLFKIGVPSVKIKYRHGYRRSNGFKVFPVFRVLPYMVSQVIIKIRNFGRYLIKLSKGFRISGTHFPEQVLFP